MATVAAATGIAPDDLLDDARMLATLVAVLNEARR